MTDAASDGGAAVCPACGRQVLLRAHDGESCPVCGWEDDARQAADPDDAGEPNGLSLAEARTNVARFGQAFPPAEVGGS